MAWPWSLWRATRTSRTSRGDAVTEPRFHTGVSDPDETAPISGEALDSLRASAGVGGTARADRGGQHDGGSHADRSASRVRGAAHAEGLPTERPAGRVPRAASAGEGSAASRDGDRQAFRAGVSSSEPPFAARYVDPAYRQDQPADRGTNGRSGYQASYGSPEQGRSSPPGEVPATHSSHQPSGHRPAGSAGSSASTDRPAATTGHAGYSGQAAGPGGGAGPVWGGYGTSSYAGGHS